MILVDVCVQDDPCAPFTVEYPSLSSIFRFLAADIMILVNACVLYDPCECFFNKLTLKYAIISDDPCRCNVCTMILVDAKVTNSS